jgi:hypothetical protein
MVDLREMITDLVLACIAHKSFHRGGCAMQAQAARGFGFRVIFAG